MTSVPLDPFDALSAEEALDALGAPEPGPAVGEERPGMPEPTCLLLAPSPSDVPWAAKGFLLAREITLIAGAGGSGKSTVMLAIAAARAGGTGVFGAYATQAPGPVLIVSEEDPLDIWLNRLDALIAGMGLDRSTVLGNTYMLALEGARLSDPRWQRHLRACCERLGVELVCFDPLADLLGDGEHENSPDRARAVIQFLRQLTADGATVLVAHHLSKPRDGYGAVDRVRGAGSWTNAARSVYGVEKEGEEILLTCSKANRIRRPDPIRLSLRVEVAQNNPARWVSATLEVEASWKLTDPDRLTASERAVLVVLDRNAHEALSWTRLREESGLAKNRLGEVTGELVRRGRVSKAPSGRKGANGKPSFAYSITPDGIAALYSPAPQVRRSGAGPEQVRGPAADLSDDHQIPRQMAAGPGRSGAGPETAPDSQVRRSAPPYMGADPAGPDLQGTENRAGLEAGPPWGAQVRRSGAGPEQVRGPAADLSDDHQIPRQMAAGPEQRSDFPGGRRKAQACRRPSV